jgi:uncharacterized damage-inducible protein DinB
MDERQSLEPWLRGTLTETPAVPRAVLHALALAKEDMEHWCGGLNNEQLNTRPGGIASIAFHIRHIARSIDRLLTYAEGEQLSDDQIAALKTELVEGGTKRALFSEFAAALEKGTERIRALDSSRLGEPRNVGGKRLPTTLAGLLIHIADHTQRHVGQAITTAKIVSIPK